ncbi:cardiolipin synthase [Chitinispirillales bacterium ANBcel5]|uniref:cardiolipin synthase n=1 Tax=Cellulosispirillum alkaliphilum TaxID=3039283 RepID=UPI002A5329AF|nr:cardiolipin synthase [Chitinispirillales bacterium ANBcel5]
MKKNDKNHSGLLRIALVVVAVLLQLFMVGMLSLYLRQNYLLIFLVFELLAITEVIYILSRNHYSAFSTSWIVIFLVSPVFGYILYLLWGNTRIKFKKAKMVRAIVMEQLKMFHHDEDARVSLFFKFPQRRRMVRFLEYEGFPLYNNTKSEYYSTGEELFDAMLEDLKKAQKFIFMSYFIISQGELWQSILDILKQKAASGVVVRVMFDDLGSILTVSKDFIKELNSYGIDAVAFNPVHKYLSILYLNYRNHQKITVIDGSVAYTGGVNLADEYANITEKLGYWKDNGIRLEGDAVYSMTIIFLQMWKAQTGQKEEYLKYKSDSIVKGDGFYQPFSDGPVNDPHNPAKDMYHQIIAAAKDYVYIMTPYLVIDDSLLTQLCAASHSGVDVRIITPKRWDKWYVHVVTRSNYSKLMDAGVSIYEYTPGFIHAKTILCDDDIAIVGTINMDYRSFYLHFENGVWLCGVPALRDIKKDIMHTVACSEKITARQWKQRSLKEKAVQVPLRLLGPLL